MKCVCTTCGGEVGGLNETPCICENGPRWVRWVGDPTAFVHAAAEVEIVELRQVGDHADDRREPGGR